ncbi:MAG: SusD/RagB family nutrient-binding outer membrane lipoprotein [Prevotella sp.]|jgi:hypothetical protein
MKKISFSLIFALVLFTSCSDLETYNMNPNYPSEVNPQYLLPTICKDAFERGTDGMYAQHMVIQTDGQNSEQFYKWNRGSFDIYNGPLLQVKKMEEEAERTESPIYLALAKFFRSYYFYQLTLRFGDIPYSEALHGQDSTIFMPAYDTQEQVFEGILQNLSDADQELADQEGSTIQGDIIYDGDVNKWRRLINSFHLKVLMTLSHHETVGSHQVKQEFKTVAEKPLMRSNDDNGQLVYLDQESCRYPQFNAQWSGYYMDKTYVDRMAERKDPRLFLFCLPTNEASTAGKAIDDFTAYSGGDPTVPYDENINLVKEGKISQINDRFRISPTGEPTMLMGYAELQQILAEACVRNWINGDAQQYYENGVKASFLFYQTYATSYSEYVTPEAANEYLNGSLVKWDDQLSDSQKIERIVFQTYCVSFYQGGWDAFFNQRRTGFPSLAHLADTPIPNRWMYPTSEYQQNTEHVQMAIERQFGANNDAITMTPWWLQ